MAGSLAGHEAGRDCSHLDGGHFTTDRLKFAGSCHRLGEIAETRAGDAGFQGRTQQGGIRLPGETGRQTQRITSEAGFTSTGEVSIHLPLKYASHIP